MNDDQHRLLSLLGQPPARLTAEQTAVVLSCTPDDVTVLMRARLLKPLGDPAQNATKLFATKAVLERAKDEKWLHKATLAISGHWRGKNARKKKPATLESTPEPSASA